MIRTTLPDPLSKKRAVSKHTMICAYTTGRYRYPVHQTPYLLVANQFNPGNYQVNKQPAYLSDKSFLFLNPGDNLEIDFPTPKPRQTWLLQFDTDLVKNILQANLSSDRQLLDAHYPEKALEFYIPALPFYLNDPIRQKLDQIKALSLLRLTDDQVDGPPDGPQDGPSDNQLDDPLVSPLDSPLDGLVTDLFSDFLLLHRDTARQISRIGSVKKATREELYKRLTMAKEYMEDHSCGQVTIAEIASHACLNRFHFLRSFKTLFGTTPHQYIIKLKLEQAHHFLNEKRYTVSEVCSMVGFESVGTFSNLYKRRFGASPSKQMP
ncbi:helix-turn-helix domain-containing protein [Flavitalea flava]